MIKFEDTGNISRVYMLTPEMESISGVAASLTILATELAHRGIDVWVFVRRPVPKSNQYARRLRSHQIHLVSPPSYLGFLTKADWLVRDRILSLVVWMLLPLFFPFVILDSVRKRRSMVRSWKGMAGYLNRILNRFLLPDYLDRVFYRQLSWHARRYPPDVVEVSRSDYLEGIQWGYERGIPTIYKECGAPESWSEVQEGFIKKAACVTAKSEAASQALQTVSGYEGDIVVIPNAFDQSLLSIEPDSPVPGVWSLAENTRLISIGRLSPEKGVQFLPPIVKHVLDKAVPIELLIIGNGELENELKQLCIELNISKHVRFLGTLKHAEVLQLLQEADILLLPSLTEGLPNVVLEAMACGVTVVATNAGGTPDLIEDGVTGILTPPAESEAMAEAVVKLARDRPLLEALGKAGREAFLSGPWTPEALGNRTLEVYRQAVATVMKSEAQVVQ